MATTVATIVKTLSDGISGARVQQALLKHFGVDKIDATHFAALVPHTRDTIAFQDTVGRTLTFGQINDAIKAASVLLRGHRVAIVMPNSLELVAAIIVTIATGATAIPICYTNPPEEIARDISDLRADTLMLLDGDADHNWVVESGLNVVRVSDICKFNAMTLDLIASGEAADAALLIQTSGSTGKKKIVPYTVENLTVGVTCIAASMELGEDDVCCCMMPLFHAGGIFRSVLCPLLTGSRVVIHNSFSAIEFWKTMASMKYTWYYGSPTMHASILEHHSNKTPCNDIRIIANAAGGLLPVLAKRLAKTFPCATVMPSYGMTECMPIAAPPVTYKLEKEKSSGRIIGPEVCIMDVSLGVSVPPGTAGAICIRGPPTFHGYEGTDSTETFLPGGWFNTGDLGYLDSDNYLFITGRAKEVIKRGGETISPYEVEEQLLKHPKIRHAVAFSVPHATLQEVVGLVVVPKNAQDPPTYADIIKHASHKLHPSKWPAVIVYAAEPPKGPTGKIVRVGLASKWGIPPMSENATTGATYKLQDGAAVSYNVPETSSGASRRKTSPEWKALTTTERTVLTTIRATLRCEIGVDDDFFLQGGDSIKAAHVAATLSQKLGKNINPIHIFQHRTARKLSALAPETQEESTSHDSDNQVNNNINKTSQTSLLALFVQLLPLAMFRPLTRYLVFAFGHLVWTFAGRNIAALGPALIAANAFKRTVLPVVTVVFKWIVLGRLRPGRYPLWGHVYLRWWLVQQLENICGLGVFGWTFGLHRAYMRMMGARIGNNARVSVDAHIGDYDLLDIGDDVAIDPRAYVRPTMCSESSFVVDPICLGRGVLVGRGACVVPGTCLTEGSWVMPNTASQFGTVLTKGVANTKSELIAPRAPLHLRVFLGYPCLILLNAIESFPLYIVAWLWGGAQAPVTMSCFMALVVMYTVATPIVRIVYTIIVKNVLLGKFKLGPTNDFENFKYWLMNRLLPQPDLAGMQSLVGTHWAPINWILRALGVKVGERVFWPGSGVNIDAYDLVTIEDNVVWGSRSVVRCRDSTGDARPVVIQAGSNVADRCIVYRGARIGRNACLGTGSVARENTVYAKGTLWIGNDAKNNEGGAVCLVGPETQQAQASAAQSTLKPFGKVKSYWLPPWWVWAAMETFVTLTVAVFRVLPIILNGPCLLGFVLTQWGVDATCIALDIIAKWVIIGRRRVGQYPWDKSDYCMMWNFNLVVQRIRGKLLDLVGGSAYIVMYYRALGAIIGHNTCIFPIGSDPMLTEPDLVKIGDGACVNHAYVINHVNTRGDFQLNKVDIGSYCTLHAHSRAMAGSVMEPGSMLLERSLLMPGEKLAKNKKKSGWP